MLEQIQELRLVLLDRSLHQYRFYSSSLLIIYEGQPGPGHKETGYEEDSMDCEQFDQAISADNNKEIVKQIVFDSSNFLVKAKVKM